METSFILKEADLNNSFLEALKILFKNKKQLEIKVSVPEDFNLLQSESPKEVKARLKKCLHEMENKANVIELQEDKLQEFVIEKL